MEALLHFSLIFSFLYIIGVSSKKGFIVSLFAPLVDLDVLFGFHRWFFHSVLVILAVGVPLVFLLRNSKLKKFAPLVLIAVVSHPLMDAFCGYTPLFWPVSGNSFWVKLGVDLEVGSSFAINNYFHVLTRPTEFSEFVHLEGPLITGTGLVISVVLLFPIMVRMVRERFGSGSKIDIPRSLSPDEDRD